MASKRSVVEGTPSDYKTRFLHQIFEERLTDNCICQPALYYHDTADGVRATSFEELNKKANRFAACIIEFLRNTNAERNQDGDYVIAVCMATTDNVIAALLAIWKAGAAYLPLEPNFPLNRIQHIVNEVKPVLVIYDHNVDRSVFQNNNSLSFNDLLAGSENCSEDNIHCRNSVSCGENDVAIILYTSGSTGLPKGVRIPHSAVLNKFRWLQSTFPYSASEKVGALNSALSNVDSVVELWCPLLIGAAVLVIQPDVTKDPSKLVDLLEYYRIERLVLVPTLLSSILAYLSLRNERLLSNLKTWICCGETLTTALAENFFRYFCDGTFRLCNFYGSTEDMGDVTYHVCESIKELNGLATVPIGLPIDNTVIFILSDDLNPILPGEIGELFVAGLSLAKGYVAGREKSKFIYNRFTDNPKFDRFYRTGDFGRLIKDGCIQYEGRADSQIKVRGHRVELLEIEMILRLSVEKDDKIAVLCYHAGKADQSILAFVVLRNGTNESPIQQGNEIENVLRTKLRDFEIPHVLVVETIPLLPNGKIDRQTLLKIYENSNGKCKKPDNGATFRIHFTELFSFYSLLCLGDIGYDLTGIPDDRLEIAKTVFETIGNVIGCSARATISIQSNFYELGGNSLNSVLAVTQLRDKGHLIGVTDFITAYCLGDVLNKICLGGFVSENLTKFNAIPLAAHHKQQVISIMMTFQEKLELGTYLIESFDFNDQKLLIEQVWDYLLETDLSFAITDSDNDIVGISLNVDGQDQPKISISNGLGIILEFINSIEKPVFENRLPQDKNKVFHAFTTATSAKLTPRENVEAVQKMEEVNLEIAKRKDFIGISATNISTLTQQLASSIYGYRTLVDYQINKYVRSDGTKPFGKAPDSQRVLMQWKNITEFYA